MMEYPDFRDVCDKVYNDYFSNFVPDLQDNEYLLKNFDHFTPKAIQKVFEEIMKSHWTKVTGSGPVQELFLQNHHDLESALSYLINAIAFN